MKNIKFSSLCLGAALNRSLAERTLLYLTANISAEILTIMRIRLVRDEDYAEIARLRRQTIRNVNSRDYPEEVIHSWSTKVGARHFRESAKDFYAINGYKVIKKTIYKENKKEPIYKMLKKLR